jgi:hypothetical protein
MKKLESLKDEKFEVQANELLQIRGGYGTGTVASTYMQRDTRNGTDTEVMDDRTDD